MAGVSGVRYGNLNYKAWEYHEKDLYNQSDNWLNLRNNNENLPLIVAGDFNQTRFNGTGYGTKKVREILTQILKELEKLKDYVTTETRKVGLTKTGHNILSMESMACILRAMDPLENGNK